MYKEKRPPRSEFVPIRGISYHLLHWGQTSGSLPPLVLVHGWMDVAASYQFVVKLINLEGFGMPATRPSQAPERFAKWMDELKSLHKGELALKPYNDVDGVARRLMRTNPRLPADKADWLARHWASPDAGGQWKILGDAAHKIVNAQLYRVDEVLEIYQRISAPMLAIEASDDSLGKWWQGKYSLAEYHERLKSVPQVTTAVIQDAGHMLHHDQPEQLARLIEGFLR